MHTSVFPRFLPKIQDIFFISIFVMVLLLGNRMLNLDGDLPRHLLTGKYILQTHHVPDKEPFIYPYQNRPYVSHEWLSDLIFYLIYTLFGLKGIVVFCASLLAFTFTLIYKTLVKNLNLYLSVFFLVTWGAIATSLNWATRPHLISMFILAIWLIQADKLRRGENIQIWQFPLLMLLWSNLHGEFIAGILVLFSFAIGWIVDFIFDPTLANKTQGKKLWAVLGLSILASLLNPAGIGPWFSILGFVNNQYLMSRMLEANTPNFQASETRILLLLITLSIFLMAFKTKKLSAGQSLLLAGFSAMSLMAFRNIHLYGVVAPFIIAESLIDFKSIPLFARIENSLHKIEAQISGGFWSLIPMMALSILMLTSQTANKLYQFEQPAFPIQAVEWLKDHPQEGNMLNDLNWGGYLALQIWPNQKTFIDSMADVSGEVTKQYETIITLAPGWENIFDQYNVEWIIVPVDSPLASELVNIHKWQMVYKDKTAVIVHK